MNWKTELHLTDLEGARRIEVMCKKCGAIRHETASDLLLHDVYRQMRLSELENDLRCRTRHCRGRVRIALGHNHKNEGFTGGMA